MVEVGRMAQHTLSIIKHTWPAEFCPDSLRVCVCALGCEHTSPLEAPWYAQNACVCDCVRACVCEAGLRFTPASAERRGRVRPVPKGVNTVQCFGHAKLMEQLGSPRTQHSWTGDKDSCLPLPAAVLHPLITPWSQAISSQVTKWFAEPECK